MADPATLYTVGVPRDQTPVTAAEIRNNFQALLQNNFTTDPNFPENPQEYAFRLFDDINDPVQAGNLRLQVFFGGQWRDVIQNLQGGTAVPSKSLVDFSTGGAVTPWVIDHNLGTQPLVQVIAPVAPFQLYTPISATAARREIRYLGRVDLNGVAPGLVRANMALPYNGTIIRTFAVTETPIPDPVDVVFNFTRNATGLTPEGDIAINVASATRGQEFPGAGLPTNANFVAGDTLQLDLVVNTAPTGGAVEVYAELERTLQATEYRLTHTTNNRLTIDFAAPTTGFAILVG